jgi:HAD superfamily hydrolase (TIGR01459 family)
LTKIITSLDVLADRYDATFCDVWGVLHNGRVAYPAACAALQRFRRVGKYVILITNVPKPREPIPAQLDRAGVPRDAWDAIVTSGDATRVELAKRAPGPVFRIGPREYDRTLWEGLDIAEAPLDGARFIGISGLNRDDETPADYADVLKQAKARDLDLICANPDIVVQHGDRLIWCAGAIARDYEAIGGHVIMAGKPHKPIYELARKELALLSGPPAIQEELRILCIGDGVVTDILGANAQGLDSLFVAAGIHGETLWTDGALDPVKVDAALAAENARATYSMAALA